MSILQFGPVNITTSEVDEISLLVGDATSANIGLNALTDVSLSNPTNGQILVYNGSNFINQTVNFASALQPGDDVSELVNNAGYLTSETLDLATFKQVVADSTDFADFQARVAAL